MTTRSLLAGVTTLLLAAPLQMLATPPVATAAKTTTVARIGEGWKIIRFHRSLRPATA